MSEPQCTSASFSYDSFLAPGNEEESYAPLLVSQASTSSIFESLDPFASPSPSPASNFQTAEMGEVISLLGAPSIAPPPPPAEKDVEVKLRGIVDDLLRRKRAARDALAEENSSLRAQVSLLQNALVQASAQPESVLADLFSEVQRERKLRVNAEDSRIATGKYLAEQVERLSLQKATLERTVASFTHGRDFWRTKAIAALERCEVLEEENLQVKSQLSAMVKKQDGVVGCQVSESLREVVEERDRLKQLEEVHPLAERTNVELKTHPKNVVKSSSSKLDLAKSTSESKFFGNKTGKRFASYKITLDARRGFQQSKKGRA